MEFTAFELGDSPKAPKAILVFLHGVGANERAMLPIAEFAGAEYRRIMLRAPITVSETGFAWFHVRFSSTGPVINEAEARNSLDQLKSYFAALREGQPGVPIYMVGFSQGAIMSLLTAMTSRDLIDGAICFSGRLPQEFVADLLVSDPANTLRLWISHGVHDTVLPIHCAHDIKTALEERDYHFAYREYDAAHMVAHEMMADAFAWLALDG